MPNALGLFEAPDGAAYCITRWHPSIDIGHHSLDRASNQARCVLFKSIHNVPWSFSFFEGTLGSAVIHRGDQGLRVLVHSRRTDAGMRSVFVLTLDFELLQGYTFPFILRSWAEVVNSQSVQMIEETNAGENAPFLCTKARSRGLRTPL